MIAGTKVRFSGALSRLTVHLVSAASNLWPLTGVALGFVGALVMIGSKIAPIERDYLDLLMKQRDVRVLDGPDSPITMVMYDNEDSQLYGKDVDRQKLDELVSRILKAGPAAVILDLQFSEEDRPAVSVANALDEIRARAPGTPDDVVREIRKKYDPTSALLGTLESGPVVGAFFSSGLVKDSPAFGEDELPPEPDPFVFSSDKCESFYAPAEKVFVDRPEFLARIPHYGNVRLETDGDGPVRRYNLFTRIDRRDADGEIVPLIYPSLALSAATFTTDPDEPRRFVAIDCRGSKVSAFSIGTGESVFDLANSPDAGFLVDFGGTFEESFPNHLTFREVLQKELPERFAGKVIFIGLQNPYQDKYPTIHDPIFPGVAIHATVAYDLLTEHQLRRNDYFHERLLEPLSCLLIGLLVTIWFFFTERWWILVFSPAFAIAGHVASVQLLSAGYLVNMLIPGMVGAMGILGCGAMRAVIDQRIAARERRRAEQERFRAEQQSVRAEQQRIRAEEQQLRAERLGAFLSPDVAKIAGENPELLKPQRQEISILFSDIRSFTTKAEGMPPEALAVMLSEYLTWMTEIVLSNHGTLDKYIGDAVMAIFGAPLPQEAHARWACTTALEMMDALDSLNERWREQGRVTLEIGIGINTGQVVVGTMGSQKKPEYTCIGDEVNFASRAEGLTKAYGAAIIVGEATRKLAGDDFVFRELGPVKVKGKTRGVKIYELVGTKAAVGGTEWVDTFHQGLNAFLLRDWDKAEDLFERARSMRGGVDGPSKAFLVWTKSFRAHPPDEAWDGTLERAEK